MVEHVLGKNVVAGPIPAPGSYWAGDRFYALMQPEAVLYTHAVARMTHEASGRGDRPVPPGEFI